MTKMFSDEFLRELNFKADLIRKAEALRKSNNVRYSKLVDKYGAEHKKLKQLSVKDLKAFIEEI